MISYVETGLMRTNAILCHLDTGTLTFRYRYI